MRYLIIILILFIQGCGITKDITEPEFNKWEPSTLKFEELSSVMTTPLNICNYTSMEIEYKKDEVFEDENRIPEITWKLRNGDCEDFAIFVAYFLEKIGYEYQIIFLWNNKGGHAITAWKVSDNCYRHSNNGKYRHIKYSSYEDIAKVVMPDYNKIRLLKLEDLIK